MSSIAVTASATGAGVITLAAPVTATNRTITLPDVTATVITDSAGVLNIGAGQVYKDASGSVGIGQSYGLTNSRLVVAGQSPGGDGTYATGRGSVVLNETNRVAINDTGGVEFKTSVFSAGYGAKIMALDNGALVFGNRDNSATYTERVRIDASGTLLVGTTSTVGGDSPKMSVSGDACIATKSASTNLTAAIGFHNPNGRIGYIGVSGTTTSYVTSSDYRLKNTTAPMTGALAKVALLKPVTYKWNADGSDGQGFIAHELAEVEPGCVTGEKDAVDAEGKPQYQGIDTSFLVATLTAAIQELKAIVDAQGAEIAALKGASA
jgi:hypothetical protein